MWKTTIVFGGLLVLVGIVGYFGSSAEKVSVTALIPAFFGLPLVVCGLIAARESLRMHAMHASAVIGLMGALAALGRGATKFGALFSDDPSVNKRPIVMVLIMAALCTVYVVLCVKSFVDARRRRRASES